MSILNHLDFKKRGGLLPVIVQESQSLKVLMLGYTNREALDETLSTGLATFFSTSRNELWTKGKTSGDYLAVDEIRVDCDEDALIYFVTLKGSGACHTKNKKGLHRTSCFFRKIDQDQLILLPGEE